MGRKAAGAQRPDWNLIETEYVFGTETSYGALARKYGVSQRAVEWQASPKRRGWGEKRERFLQDVRAEAQKRLSGRAAADEVENVKPFREAYAQSTQKMQTFLDLLLEKFIPNADADEKAKKACKERLDALSPKEQAGLIISATDRLSGVAKVLQLLGGNPTEIFETKAGMMPVDVSPEVEAEIERALRDARRGR